MGRRVGEAVWLALDVGARELLGFAAFGILLLGLDDLLFDAAWLLTGPRRRRLADGVRAATGDTRLAVLIPAWDESAVIGAMLRHTLERWTGEALTVWVGVYPNDPATAAAVRRVAEGDDRVRIVMVPHPGPTTKADCLNAIWRAVEAAGGADAVVLHDAEDVVAAGEPAVLRRLLAHHDMVQLPVVPAAVRPDGGRQLFRRVRGGARQGPADPPGAGRRVPGAGVGCAIRCAALRRLDEGAGPFPRDSLVEDYELGLRLHAAGARTLFVPIGAADGAVVRAQFPVAVAAAVRQKSRWVAGIALNGWDRTGWRAHPGELWMRLRDRRAPLAALVLCAGYAGLVGATALMAGHWIAGTTQPSFLTDRWLVDASGVTALLLLWRLAVRGLCSAAVGGAREGLRALPRSVASNIVAILAARRAIGLYVRWRRTGTVRWDKTAHEFAEPAQ